MEEGYLQVGFEIKLACDALSRRLMRWHWEKTPRPHTLHELQMYVQARTEEAPDYYANIPYAEANPTWQQLDTTFCMRVLLDGETNAQKPKNLLQYAVNEHAARRACNGLRIARNAAAHATNKEGVAKAIATFDETLTDLERAYGMTLFGEDELAQYDILVERAIATCAGKSKPKVASKTAQLQGTGEKQTGAASRNTSAAQGARGSKSAAMLTNDQAKKTSRASARQKNQCVGRVKKNLRLEKGFGIVALLVFFAGLWARYSGV